MTAPNGPILFNSGGGSDTEASGLGPIPAVFGSGASTTSASAVVTGIDTTGVVPGDLLWVQSTSGRQFSIIASVDSGTQVTCDDVFANTESGRTWAIGGKRAQLWSNTSSRRILIDDGKGDWIAEMGSGYTDTYSTTLDTNLSIGTGSGRFVVRGEDGASVKPVVTWASTGQAVILRSSPWRFENFDFLASNSGATYCFNSVGTSHIFRNLRLAGTGSGQWQEFDDNSTTIHQFIGCEFDGFSGSALTANDGTTLRSCLIHNCGSHGVSLSGPLGASIENCVIANNGGDGINASYTGNQQRTIGLCNNVIYGNVGDGIKFTATPSLAVNNIRIMGNIIAANGGYGINFSNASSTLESLRVYGLILAPNAYWNNTSGAKNPSGIESYGEVTLTADPFVDAAGGDFNINNTSGGGALLRAATVVLP